MSYYHAHHPISPYAHPSPHEGHAHLPSRSPSPPPPPPAGHPCQGPPLQHAGCPYRAMIPVGTRLCQQCSEDVMDAEMVRSSYSPLQYLTSPQERLNLSPISSTMGRGDSGYLAHQPGGTRNTEDRIILPAPAYGGTLPPTYRSRESPGPIAASPHPLSHATSAPQHGDFVRIGALKSCRVLTKGRAAAGRAAVYGRPCACSCSQSIWSTPYSTCAARTRTCQCRRLRRRAGSKQCQCVSPEDLRQQHATPCPIVAIAPTTSVPLSASTSPATSHPSSGSPDPAQSSSSRLRPSCLRLQSCSTDSSTTSNSAVSKSGSSL